MEPVCNHYYTYIDGNQLINMQIYDVRDARIAQGSGLETGPRQLAHEKIE